MNAPRSLEDLAADPSLHPDLQLDLLRRGDVAVRVALARRHGLDGEIARRLAKDRSVKVRTALAARVPHDQELIATLAADRSEAVRRAFVNGLGPDFGVPGQRADRRAALAAAAAQLAGDAEADIRAACARMTALPERWHEALARGAGRGLRAGCAGSAGEQPRGVERASRPLGGGS